MKKSRRNKMLKKPTLKKEVEKYTIGGFVGSVNNSKVKSYIDEEGRKRFKMDDFGATIDDDKVYEIIQTVNKLKVKQKYKLSEIMYFWDGYKYYRKLKYNGITFYYNEFDGKNAGYDKNTGFIVINCFKLINDYGRYIEHIKTNAKVDEKTRNVKRRVRQNLEQRQYVCRLFRRKLFHEIQHILQQAEGINPIATASEEAVVEYIINKYNIGHLSDDDFIKFICEKHNATFRIALHKEYKLIPTEKECFDVEEEIQRKYDEQDEKEGLFKNGGNVTNKKIKILYLHGLGATPESDNVEILNSDNASITSPCLVYRLKPLFDYLSGLIEKENIQGVVGHSLGGYLAYYLSNRHHIPSLLFNPYFGTKNSLQPISNDVKALSPYSNQTIVIGSKDEEKPSKEQMSIFEDGGCHIFIENIGHDIPDKIKIKYFKKFIEEIENAEYGDISTCNKLYKDHHDTWDKIESIEKDVCDKTCEKYSKEIVLMWESDLKEHFLEEENNLFPSIRDDKNAETIDGLIEEHKYIVKLINKIGENKDVDDILEFCTLIKSHIQQEETLMSEITTDPLKNDNFDGSEKISTFTHNVHNINNNEIRNIISGVSEVTSGTAIQTASNHIRNCVRTNTENRISKEYKQLNEFADNHVQIIICGFP